MAVIIDGTEYIEKDLTQPSKEDIIKNLNTNFLKFLKHELEEAKLLHEDFNREELSLNRLEAEGGYRALLNTYNIAIELYRDDIQM